MGVLITSAARLVPTLRGREDFGREPALALIMVVLGTSLAIRALASWVCAALRAMRAIAATHRAQWAPAALGAERSSSHSEASSPTTRDR